MWISKTMWNELNEDLAIMAGTLVSIDYQLRHSHIKPKRKYIKSGKYSKKNKENK